MITSVDLLRTERLTKSFPGVLAVDKVDFDVRAGEIHALVGENGAGKSTLIKILGGVYLPDSGKILLDGKEIAFSSTHQSQESKIAVIFQEFNLVPDLSVAENIFIGREPKTAFGTLVDFHRLNVRAAEILATLDMPLNVKSFVSDISVAERQMVEIAKALSHESRLIIMDEPTATLTEKEVRKIFEIVKNLRAKGVSIIYISHRLEEAFELADRITVMRDGRKVGTKLIGETNKSDVIEMMVGKVVKDYFAMAGTSTEAREPLLEVRNYSVADAVEDISFTLYKGEILALAGILGSGVHRMLQSLFGVIPKKGGEIFFQGRKVEINRPRDAIKLGIGYVTEDRKNAGLLPAMSVLHNLTIIIVRALSFLRGLFIRVREESRRFEGIRTMLDIKMAGPGQQIIYLSGGNQQKVLIGRTLLTDCKALILLEPTRGIDVGAKAEIHKMLRALADKGLAIILTSSELPELVNLPDRCIVLYKGRKAAEFTRETMDSEKLVAAQIGHSASEGGARP
jgi:ABC-type sugar transport system ATPase subunit